MQGDCDMLGYQQVRKRIPKGKSFLGSYKTFAYVKWKGFSGMVGRVCASEIFAATSYIKEFLKAMKHYRVVTPAPKILKRCCSNSFLILMFSPVGGY